MPAADPQTYLRRRKELRYLRRQDPAYITTIPNTEAVAHMRMLQSYGWAVLNIADRAGVNDCVLHDHLNGRYSMIHRDTAASILGVQLTAEDIELGPGLTAHGRNLGAYRILKGLQAVGWPQKTITRLTGLNHWLLRRVACPPAEGIHARMSREMYLRIRSSVQKLEPLDPFDHATSRSVNYCITKAAQEGHAPLAAWDLDTIHLPDSSPDWTGECGTVEGYYLHIKYDIQVRHVGNGTKADAIHGKHRKIVQCQPCWDAHDAASDRMYTRHDYDAIWDAITDRDAGYTAQQVADMFGCTSRTVERVKSVKRMELGL